MKIVRKVLFFFLICFFNSNFTFGQENNNRLWSATQKLTINDFAIKTSQLETVSSYAQFSVDFSINGFDFLTKNFNKKVRNKLIVSASWIDTTSGVNQSLAYQQALFNICEIYTRQFRKALGENRKKIARGKDIAEELNNQFMTEFAKRRMAFDIETKSGTDERKRANWETQILKELDELRLFAYEKT